MTRRRSTRNPVRVRAVQFSSRLVGTYGCGQVRHDSGRVRPARFLACGRATAQIGPENSAGCGSGSMFGSECHALVGRVKVEFIAVESVIVGSVTLDVVTVDRSTVNLVAVGGAFSGCMVGSVTVVKVAVCRVVTVEVGSDLPVESRLGHGTVGHSSNRMMHHEF